MTDQHGGKLPSSNGQDGGTAAVVPSSISLDQVTHQVDGSVSLDEAAQQLGISDRTVRRRIKEGTLAAYKLETPRGQVWRVYLPGASADSDLPPRRQADQDGGSLPGRAAAADTSAVSDANTSPEVMKALELIEHLQHEHTQVVERLQRENQQLAGQVGFLQARVQEQERQIALLPAPNDLTAAEVRARVAETERAQLQAKLQDAEEQIRLLSAPKDEPPIAQHPAATDSANVREEPPRRSLWARVVRRLAGGS